MDGCIFVLEGITVIIKKQIIASINLLLPKYYFCYVSLFYLCTRWETKDILPQAFFILIGMYRLLLSLKITGVSDT
ncbi:hypothetical protein BtSCAC15_31695 (plasmid) [Bacillus thuringiensis]|nr:hypothetical protein BtSCAC15_31695 [Bacillus thuringiensis]